MKTIAEQLNITEFPFEIKDKHGNKIYFEDSEGCWEKKEYNSQGKQVYYENSTIKYWWRREIDSKGNEVHYEDSDGYWSKREFDSKGNIIYFERSNGFWTKREYDSQGNEIFFENSNGEVIDKRVVPEYTMEELVEKLGNFKIKK